jgi:hypothetical protein
MVMPDRPDHIAAQIIFGEFLFCRLRSTPCDADHLGDEMDCSPLRARVTGTLT